MQDSSDDGELKGSDVLTVSSSNSLDTWVMDTGASYDHMTFNKQWFHSFKGWHNIVTLGDDEQLPVIKQWFTTYQIV